MWKDALALEMFNVGVAFEILEEGQPAPLGWSKVSGHLIWDIKMDFTRKARWVLDGLHLKYWRKVNLHPWDGVRYPDISYGTSRWTLPGKRGGSWMDTEPQTQSGPSSQEWFQARVFE